MIGNDIVDLAQARKESHWQRKGYLAKLFTAHEQYLIHASDNPERMVWILWSMKESAYKATFRQTRLRRFAPQKINCQLSSITPTEAYGTVFYEVTYRTKTIITPNYISSLAFPLADSFPYQQFVVVFDRADLSHQSAQLHQTLRQHCAQTLAIPACNVSLLKTSDGVPTVLINQPTSGSVDIPISLSHHGHYGAYAIGWPAS